MLDISTIASAAEFAGIILMFVAIIFMIKIAKITGGFSAWYILSAALGLIIVRRAITIYAPFSSFPKELGYTNSALLLVISIFYVIGFYKLYVLFKNHRQ